jgi:hypothetical protein
MNPERQHGPSYIQALAILRRVLSDARNGRDQEIEEILAAREQVIRRYQPIFSPAHIAELTTEEFTSFLGFKNNRHWSGIDRQRGIVSEDMASLRRTLSLLLDESVPIRDRIDATLARDGAAAIRGLGKAVITPILLIAYPDRYGVWNTPAEKGMKRLGLWPAAESGDTVGGTYERANGLLQRVAGDLGIDLWTLDALWWRIASLDDPETARPEVTEDDFEDAVYTLEELDRSVPLDQRREVSIRTEQGFLRQYLFGTKQEHTCTICGRVFPAKFLRAAHIKRRADCSVEEKLDYKNNVTPMCTFGCDELFERGYIVVRNGRVGKGQWVGVTPPVQDYIAGITDRPCLPYYRGSRPYFDWHAQKYT